MLINLKQALSKYHFMSFILIIFLLNHLYFMKDCYFVNFILTFIIL
jgi:hypothetical protein